MSTNKFISPPQQSYGSASDFSKNAVYALNDQIPITWVTNYTTYHFQLYQEKPQLDETANGTEIFSTNTPSQSPKEIQSFNWTVSIYPFDLDAYPVFYILCGNATGGHLFASAPFNITAAISLPTTSVVLPTTAVMSSSLSTGTQVGIGIAVAIAGLVLISAALFFAYRHGQRSSLEVVVAPVDVPPSTGYSSTALKNPFATEIYASDADKSSYYGPPEGYYEMKSPSIAYPSPSQPQRSAQDDTMHISVVPGYHEVGNTRYSMRPELP